MRLGQSLCVAWIVAPMLGQGNGECGADAIASPVPTRQGLPRHQLGQHLPRPEFKKQVDQGCELLGILRGFLVDRVDGVQTGKERVERICDEVPRQNQGHGRIVPRVRWQRQRFTVPIPGERTHDAEPSLIAQRIKLGDTDAEIGIQQMDETHESANGDGGSQTFANDARKGRRIEGSTVEKRDDFPHLAVERRQGNVSPHLHWFEAWEVVRTDYTPDGPCVKQANRPPSPA